MAFAGMSLIADGKLCDLTVSPIDARANRGYHLLVVEGYWRSKGTPNGEFISSRPFLVGGHRWHIKYYPNGFEEEDEEFISVYLVLDDNVEEQEVKAQAVFSFIDQPELRTSTRISEYEIEPRLYGQDQFIRRNILERSRHLKEDSFIIRCDVVVAKTSVDADTDTDKAACSTTSCLEMLPSDMQRQLGDLLFSKEDADIIFKVGEETFSAHRCLLAARSTVFKEQLFGGTGTTTKKENIIEITDIEPEIFQDLLDYIYTDSFPDWKWIKGDEEEEEEEEETESGEEYGEYITWLLQLIEAADRYDLQRLKSICAEELVGYICRSRVADIVVVAERRHCHWLKDMCVEFIKSNSSVCTVLTAESLEQIIRTCSPSVLKELIFKFAP